jgi:hypothetical protein
MKAPPARHWRIYGNDKLPTGAEALNEPFSAFPSWFLRITCDRCGKLQPALDQGLLLPFRLWDFGQSQLGGSHGVQALQPTVGSPPHAMAFDANDECHLHGPCDRNFC